MAVARSIIQTRRSFSKRLFRRFRRSSGPVCGRGGQRCPHRRHRDAAGRFTRPRSKRSVGRTGGRSTGMRRAIPMEASAETGHLSTGGGLVQDLRTTPISVHPARKARNPSPASHGIRPGRLPTPGATNSCDGKRLRWSSPGKLGDRPGRFRALGVRRTGGDGFTMRLPGQILKRGRTGPHRTTREHRANVSLPRRPAIIEPVAGLPRTAVGRRKARPAFPSRFSNRTGTVDTCVRRRPSRRRRYAANRSWFATTGAGGNRLSDEVQFAQLPREMPSAATPLSGEYENPRAARLSAVAAGGHELSRHTRRLRASDALGGTRESHIGPGWRCRFGDPTRSGPPAAHASGACSTFFGAEAKRLPSGPDGGASARVRELGALRPAEKKKKKKTKKKKNETPVSRSSAPGSYGERGFTWPSESAPGVGTRGRFFS